MDGQTRAERLSFANSSICVLGLAKLGVAGGRAGSGKLSFANLSTCVLECAELRWGGQPGKLELADLRWWVVGHELLGGQQTSKSGETGGRCRKAQKQVGRRVNHSHYGLACSC